MQPVTVPPLPRSQPAVSRPLMPDKMEGAFLEQMMKYMGPKPLEGTGSGGTGEAQFQSLLTQEYARIMAARIDLRICGRMDR